MRYRQNHCWRWTLFSALWVIILSIGYYLFGPHGAFAFGATFGVSVICIAVSTVKRRHWRRIHRRLLAITGTGFALIGFAISGYFYSCDYHITRSQMRQADRLEKQLRIDKRYQSVTLEYYGPPMREDRWIAIGGSIDRAEDLSQLRTELSRFNFTRQEWDLYLSSENRRLPKEGVLK